MSFAVPEEMYQVQALLCHRTYDPREGWIDPVPHLVLHQIFQDLFILTIVRLRGRIGRPQRQKNAAEKGAKRIYPPTSPEWLPENHLPDVRK